MMELTRSKTIIFFYGLLLVQVSLSCGSAPKLHYLISSEYSTRKKINSKGGDRMIMDNSVPGCFFNFTPVSVAVALIFFCLYEINSFYVSLGLKQNRLKNGKETFRQDRYHCDSTCCSAADCIMGCGYIQQDHPDE
jgi:hypothetical protein